MKIKRTLFPLTMTALGTALIAVCAFITLTFGDLKFTLQLFAVLLISGLFPLVYAFASILAYLLLGALGVPVFAGFQGDRRPFRAHRRISPWIPAIVPVDFPTLKSSEKAEILPYSALIRGRSACLLPCRHHRVVYLYAR